MKQLRIFCFLLSVLLVGCVPITPQAAQPGNDLIANAMSGGLRAIAKEATISDWASEVRQGSNGWTCWTDDPTTPTNDPICGDQQWAEFISAFYEQREPTITAIGIGYMLQGGSTASLTDPAATEPPAGQEWLIDGPHLMLLVPWQLDPAAYASDPHAGGPYIMYGGTPYEHLMVPVTEMSH